MKETLKGNNSKNSPNMKTHVNISSRMPVMALVSPSCMYLTWIFIDFWYFFRWEYNHFDFEYVVMSVWKYAPEFPKMWGTDLLWGSSSYVSNSCNDCLLHLWSIHFFFPKKVCVVEPSWAAYVSKNVVFQIVLPSSRYTVTK